MSSTLTRLTEVFRTVFDDDSLVIGPQTTARDVDGWDSLMHVSLMIEVERVFRIKFTSAEVAGLPDVGSLIQLVERKSGASAT